MNRSFSSDALAKEISSSTLGTSPAMEGTFVKPSAGQKVQDLKLRAMTSSMEGFKQGALHCEIRTLKVIEERERRMGIIKTSSRTSENDSGYSTPKRVSLIAIEPRINSWTSSSRTFVTSTRATQDPTGSNSLKSPDNL